MISSPPRIQNMSKPRSASSDSRRSAFGGAAGSTVEVAPDRGEGASGSTGAGGIVVAVMGFPNERSPATIPPPRQRRETEARTRHPSLERLPDLPDTPPLRPADVAG